MLNKFLADRTNGRAIGTLFRLSVYNVKYCG